MEHTPRGWGKDQLSAYLVDYRGNQFATFDNKRAAVGDLIKIDELFVRVMHGAVNPRPMVPLTFMLRSHSAYRAAVGAIMAGQLFEAHALMRLCLEHGAYGFYIGADAERWERWERRMDSEGNKEAVRREFSMGKIRSHFKANAKVLGKQFEYLYERTIDFGAHPNERGFSMNTNIRTADGNKHFEAVYLQGDGPQLDLNLKMVGQVGLWVLHVMQVLYMARFELLGVRTDLEVLRVRY